MTVCYTGGMLGACSAFGSVGIRGSIMRGRLSVGDLVGRWGAVAAFGLGVRFVVVAGLGGWAGGFVGGVFGVGGWLVALYVYAVAPDLYAAAVRFEARRLGLVR